VIAGLRNYRQLTSKGSAGNIEPKMTHQRANPVGATNVVGTIAMRLVIPR